LAKTGNGTPKITCYDSGAKIDKKIILKQKTTILSGVVKQNSNGRQQTLADLFKELVAGANLKKTAAASTSPVKPEKTKLDIETTHSVNVRNSFQANEFLSRQAVSNLTAR
jgi:hypothetical protein